MINCKVRNVVFEGIVVYNEDKQKDCKDNFVEVRKNERHLRPVNLNTIDSKVFEVNVVFKNLVEHKDEVVMLDLDDNCCVRSIKSENGGCLFFRIWVKHIRMLNFI